MTAPARACAVHVHRVIRYGTAFYFYRCDCGSIGMCWLSRTQARREAAGHGQQ